MENVAGAQRVIRNGDGVSPGGQHRLAAGGTPANPLGRQLHCRPAAATKEWQYNCHPNVTGL
jgi:hypothetical protein